MPCGSCKEQENKISKTRQVDQTRLGGAKWRVTNVVGFLAFLGAVCLVRSPQLPSLSYQIHEQEGPAYAPNVESADTED